jgi:two-component system sensor histidine kinase UhpB
MRSLSLKVGLSWLVGAVLLMTLLINVSILVMHAGPRIRAEADSNLRLTRELVVMAIASLQETDDPLPALRRFYESLGSLRHVDVKVLANDDLSPIYGPRPNSRSGGEVPDWFVALVDAPPRILIVPVLIRHASYGRIALFSNPIDELAEIWSDVSWLALISLAFTAAILALVLVLLRFSLEPFNALQLGLADLQAGRRNVRVRVRGATEFRSISATLNSLAATLDRVKDQNRSLVNELIQVQDNERKEIARDLHDEAGPCLFSIRAGAVTLVDITQGPAPDLPLVRQICANVNKASEALQTMFRGLLGRLRPRELSEFGLHAVLTGLIASWQVSRPDFTLELISPHDLSSLDEATSLTVFRIVQEGITNIFRHARADSAVVRIEFGSASGFGNSPSESECEPLLNITIEDNGVGISEQRNPGLGLLGMSERVQALGGTISIENRPDGGTRIVVSLPLPMDEDHSL